MGPEELAKIHVVWRFLKPEATAVVEVHGKLSGETLRMYFSNAFVNQIHLRYMANSAGKPWEMFFLMLLSIKFI